MVQITRSKVILQKAQRVKAAVPMAAVPVMSRLPALTDRRNARSSITAALTSAGHGRGGPLYTFSTRLSWKSTGWCQNVPDTAFSPEGYPVPVVRLWQNVWHGQERCLQLGNQTSENPVENIF